MFIRILSIFSLLLFAVTLIAVAYSIVFPFKAGHPLQGMGSILVVITSPIGLIAAAPALFRTSRLARTAFIGHSALLLLFFLYMTVGYLLFGV